MSELLENLEPKLEPADPARIGDRVKKNVQKGTDRGGQRSRDGREEWEEMGDMQFLKKCNKKQVQLSAKVQLAE